jgi:hypothetical protein
MAGRKLTREEIALQVMCAAISASSDSTQHLPEFYLPDSGRDTERFVSMAFAIADVFIAVRDKDPCRPSQSDSHDVNPYPLEDD